MTFIVLGVRNHLEMIETTQEVDMRCFYADTLRLEHVWIVAFSEF